MSDTRDTAHPYGTTVTFREIQYNDLAICFGVTLIKTYYILFI